MKTGVWLIGAMVILGVAENFWQAARYGVWSLFMLISGIEAVFCAMFLIMMISQSLDTYKLRCATFLYYLVMLIIVPAVLMLMAIFG